jgi:hypothetical protein
MKEERPDGIFRFMGKQLISAATKSVRDKKIADIHKKNRSMGCTRRGVL